jgi:hypothetical protein
MTWYVHRYYTVPDQALCSDVRTPYEGGVADDDGDAAGGELAGGGAAIATTVTLTTTFTSPSTPTSTPTSTSTSTPTPTPEDLVAYASWS